jgi:hypothetical protein
MNRRTFLSSGSVLCAGFAASSAVPILAETIVGSGWRAFEVATTVELLKPAGPSKIWLPAALAVETPYQRTTCNHRNVQSIDQVYGAPDFLGPIPRQFGDGIGSPGNPTFAIPNFTSPARQLQLSVRLNFQLVRRKWGSYPALREESRAACSTENPAEIPD